MSRDRPNAPTAGSRDARRSAALRANLARRKAQARERAAGPETPMPDDGPTTTHKPQEGPDAPNPASSED